MKTFKKIYVTIEDSVLIFLLASMGLVLLAQVVVRYFLQVPLTWSEELARYIQIWIAFLGIGFGFRHHSHIAMTLLSEKFPPWLKHTAQIVINLVLIGCFVLIIPTSYSFTAYQHNILSSSLRLQMSYVVSSITLASYIFIIYAVRRIIKDGIALYMLVKEKK